MTRKILTAIFLLGLSAVSGYAVSEPTTVRKVLDANSLELNDGRRVRLIGVDAPDMNDPAVVEQMAKREGIDPQVLMVYAYLAKNFIRQLVEGERVYLTFDDAFTARQHRDPDGKLLAYVWFSMHYKDNRPSTEDIKELFGISSEDRLLNTEIIKQGYAFAKEGEESFIYQREFYRQEQKAKTFKTGFWRTEPKSYDEILALAQGARIGSVFKFVPQAARALSLESARKTLGDLIRKNPEDFRAYYERSWLGADPYHDSVTEQNLQDIDTAISLAPKPKLWEFYLHRHYLLRLLGRHAEAFEAYGSAVTLLPKRLGSSVFHQTKNLQDEELPGDDTAEGKKKKQGFFADGRRASLNGEHFLLFMARFKELSSGEQDARVQRFLFELFKEGVFKETYEKYENFINKSLPHQLLYQTVYAKSGWDDPMEAIERMEKVERGKLS